MYTISVPHDLGTKYTAFSYPAGERQVRIEPSQFESICTADDIDVWYYHNLEKPLEGLMDLLLLTDALTELNDGRAAKFNVIMPYLPYSRADRAFVQGDCYGLRVFEWMMTGLWCNNLYTMDVHSSKSKACISNLVNIGPEPIIQKILTELGKDVTILLPDEGAKRYNLENFPYPVKQCTKVRNPETGALSGFDVPQIDTKNVLIVDDICDGGGTFLGIAQELDSQNPSIKMHLYTTHGIYSKGVVALNGFFSSIHTTDSIIGHPSGYKFGVNIHSAKQLKEIYDNSKG